MRRLHFFDNLYTLILHCIVLGAPPPSYAAATNEAFDITDEEDSEHIMGESSYVPQYTYYNWDESAFTYNK